MLSWLILRILSKGLFLNPHAAINSVWDILDWIFVIVSLTVMCPFNTLCVYLLIHIYQVMYPLNIQNIHLMLYMSIH